MFSSSSFFSPAIGLFAACFTMATAMADNAAPTPEQVVRLQKYLPQSYLKLSQGEPITALAIGDSIMDMNVHDENAGNVLKSYVGVFLQELADQFYYTAGVRLKNPRKGLPARLTDTIGNEITLVNAAEAGKLAIHAAQALPFLLNQKKPELALISFGLDDALAKLSLTAYRRGLQEAVDLLKAQKVDVLLISPTITVSDPPEQGLALTRLYADVMREVAEQSGVFYAELGNLSGIVKLDERYKELAPVKKPAPLDEAAAKAQAELPPSPVKIPVPDELDLDEEKHAAGFFSQLLVQCRPYFDHGGVTDPLHPNTAFHRLLGRHLFQELMVGSKPAPWKMGRAVAELSGNGKCSVTFRIDNESTDLLKVYPLPLVTSSWKPLEVPAQVEIKADRHGDITVAYQQTNKVDTHAFDQTMLRLPVLLISHGEARIETLRATLTPLSLVWLTGTKFNQTEVSVDAQVTNTTKEPLSGKWEAAWLGQKLTGTFKAAASSGAPLSLKFKLPSVTQQKGILSLILTINTTALRFDRELEAVQNIGLKQVVPLRLATDYVSDKGGAPTLDTANVTFRADADEKAFYLTWDIHGINLQESPDDNSAFIADVHLDARSYGKRLLSGVTDALILSSGAADGEGRANPLEPWSFGSGYNAKYDRNGVQSHLSSRGDGSRRFTVLIPRQYFNLHEWAMGNGNSELGINTTLSIWQPDAANPKGSFTKYVFFSNGLHPDDAEGLAVLELNEPHTDRWTVRLY